MTPIILERKDNNGSWSDPQAYVSLKRCCEANKDIKYQTAMNYFCRNQSDRYTAQSGQYRLTKATEIEIKTDTYVVYNGQRIKVL